MISRSSFKIPLYEAKVIILVATDMGELQEYILKKTKMVANLADTHGCVFLWGDGEYVLTLREGSLSHNLIAHELFHLTLHVTNDIDIEDEESQAWLVGYLTENVYKILKKKNFVIKG